MDSDKYFLKNDFENEKFDIVMITLIILDISKRFVSNFRPVINVQSNVLSNICYVFLQSGAVEKIKTNSKFGTSKSLMDSNTKSAICYTDMI